MIVVDTNIIAYLYISGEKSPQAEQLLSFDSLWNAPILWRSEFRNVLSKYLRNGILGLDDIFIAIQQAENLLDDNEYKISSARAFPVSLSPPAFVRPYMVWKKWRRFLCSMS